MTKLNGTVNGNIAVVNGAVFEKLADKKDASPGDLVRVTGEMNDTTVGAFYEVTDTRRDYDGDHYIEFDGDRPSLPQARYSKRENLEIYRKVDSIVVDGKPFAKLADKSLAKVGDFVKIVDYMFGTTVGNFYKVIATVEEENGIKEFGVRFKDESGDIQTRWTSRKELEVYTQVGETTTTKGDETMTKLKVGDRVQVLGASIYGNSEGIGKEGAVDYLFCDGDIGIQVDGMTRKLVFNRSDLKKVEKLPHDFRVGDKVRITNKEAISGGQKLEEETTYNVLRAERDSIHIDEMFGGIPLVIIGGELSALEKVTEEESTMLTYEDNTYHKVTDREHTLKGDYVVFKENSPATKKDKPLKVGDYVTANEGAPYGMTNPRVMKLGKVIEVKSNGHIRIEFVKGHSGFIGHVYTVEAKFFTKTDAPKEEKYEPKTGDIVVVTGNTNNSRNKVGDIGKVGQVGIGEARVYVPNGFTYAIWTKFNEMRLATAEEIAKYDEMVAPKEEVAPAVTHEYEVGDVVRVLEDEKFGVNRKGDIGVVSELFGTSNIFRVHVAARGNNANWHTASDVELIVSAKNRVDKA